MCKAWTASAAFSTRVTIEIRISEVEIISTLTPASARVRKNVAETPGVSACLRPPGRPWQSLVLHQIAEGQLIALCQQSGAGTCQIRGRQGDRDVGVAFSDTFCTIMSRLTRDPRAFRRSARLDQAGQAPQLP